MQCRQFLLQKSSFALPIQLARSLHNLNILVQHAGELVITYLRWGSIWGELSGGRQFCVGKLVRYLAKLADVWVCWGKVRFYSVQLLAMG